MRAEQNLQLALDAVDQIYLEYADTMFSGLLAGTRPGEKQSLGPEADKFLRKALKFYQQFAQVNDNTVAYMVRGMAQINLRQYPQATAAFSQVIARGGDQATDYNNRGLAYDHMGDFETAIADYSQSMQLTPSSPFAYANRGAAYVRQGDYDQAIADLTEALRLKPDLTVVYNRRAGAYMHKQEYGLAMAHAAAGHSQLARQWLAKATQATDRVLADVGAGGKPKAAWNRRLTLKLVRVEAEKKLERAVRSRD